MRRAQREPITRPVWFILLSWGLAVILLTGVFSYWIWSNEREQDRAMCVMLDLFTSGPPPADGPAGDRGRAVLKAMTDYRETLDCG